VLPLQRKPLLLLLLRKNNNQPKATYNPYPDRCGFFVLLRLLKPWQKQASPAEAYHLRMAMAAKAENEDI
jgi:hypothetical protein